jgi:phosphoribosylglycinamide formyltransferase-1
MYGMHVHRAVIQAQEKESGITIHLVDAVYDNGTILFQATCPVLPADTPEELAAKIQQLEQMYYPATIEKYITGSGVPL